MGHQHAPANANGQDRRGNADQDDDDQQFEQGKTAFAGRAGCHGYSQLPTSAL
ncbi:hypothetical protein D3C79_919670 [compost metagenome]